MLDKLSGEQIAIGVISSIAVVVVIFLMKRGANVIEMLPGEKTGASLFSPTFGGSYFGDRGPTSNVFDIGVPSIQGAARPSVIGSPGRNLGGGSDRGSCCCSYPKSRGVGTLAEPILMSMVNLSIPSYEPPKPPPQPTLPPRAPLTKPKPPAPPPPAPLKRVCKTEALDFERYISETPGLEAAYVSLTPRQKAYIAKLGYSPTPAISREEYGRFHYTEMGASEGRIVPKSCTEYGYV